MSNLGITNKISDYYSQKVKEFGATYKGADWGSIEAQQISFEQLIKVLPNEEVSLLDYGCGYGALYEYLTERKIKSRYTGYDISEEMIKQAKNAHAVGNARWLNVLPEKEKFDYVIACGILSVKLETTVADWQTHVLKTLDQLNEISSKGFAFNSLTSYSDPHLMKDHLYYPDPCFLFDYCKKKYSDRVALLHDYPKFEFTIIVRK